MKKFAIALCIALLTTPSFGQQSTATVKSFWDDPVNHEMFPYYVAFLFVFISILLLLVVTVYAYKVVKVFKVHLEQEKAKKLGVAYIPAPSWWSRFAQQINASVPVEHEKNIELDHSYDGIKELDNHLPPWWKWLFYGTIAWSVVYVIVFHLTDSLPLSEAEYRNEIALAEEQSKQRNANQPAAEAFDESKLTFTNDAVIIEKGKNVFANNPCGSCHRNDGGGNTIGPNLTDEFWIHGGDIKDIFNTIKNGAVDKGMPAWGKAMSAQDLRDVTFYILSLQGSNPANAKAPQGEPFKKAALVQSDSTKANTSI